MLFFGYGNGLEYHGNRILALIFRYLGKTRIHLRPLKIFTGRRFFQVIHGLTDNAGRKSPDDFDLTAFKQLKQTLGVLAFLVCGFFENIGNLYKTFLAGLFGKIGIPVSCLGFSCKSCQDIFF